MVAVAIAVARAGVGGIEVPQSRTAKAFNTMRPGKEHTNPVKGRDTREAEISEHRREPGCHNVAQPAGEPNDVSRVNAPTL